MSKVLLTIFYIIITYSISIFIHVLFNHRNVTKPKIKCHDMINNVYCCLYVSNKSISAMCYNIRKSQILLCQSSNYYHGNFTQDKNMRVKYIF